MIIAGSRNLSDPALVADAVEESGFAVTEVVSGAAKGVDREGEKWAEKHGVPVTRFPADWEDISSPDAVIRERRDGTKYDAKAGVRRNWEMAQYADALVAVWGGQSRGTESMIRFMRQLGSSVYVKEVHGQGQSGHSVTDAFDM